MSILFSVASIFRSLFVLLDGVAFSLLDNAYNVVIALSKAEILKHDTIKSIMSNLYILIGVVAFFRLALVLVNSIIDPEKLAEKGKGLSNIFFRVVGMIALLIVTPFLFQLSYELQGKIVGADTDENIIFKTILGNNASIGGKNAGKALQNIALSSLITVDKNYLKGDGAVCEYKRNADGSIDYNTVTNEGNCGFYPLVCKPNGDGTCTPQGGYVFNSQTCSWNNCQKAVSVYNEMYVNEDMHPTKLFTYIGTSTKLEIDGEKTEVFVFDYMMIVTTFVGGFLTYMILSFAIDIGVRIFELVVLEILSPLFIATFVDPKSSQSGPFKNWISTVGKSYATLYIRLAVIALLVLLISIINQAEIFQAMGDISGFAKIIAVIGLLIFAKKAPKWIGDMIGIKGDDGLGGLGIGKKLGGMALLGGLATKANDGIKKGLKKQGDKVLDHGKKHLGNIGNKMLAGYAVRKQARDAAKQKFRKDNNIKDGEKMKLADWYKANQAARAAAKSTDTKDKVKATRADIQADFKANNDMRAFASLRDKYADYAQMVNPNYQTKRQKDLDKLNQRAEDLKVDAGIDSSSMAKARKNAQDIRKATAIYGEDFVKQHIKTDGSLDKVACPVSEQQINNAYAGVLNHPPTSLAEIAAAQLKIEGITVNDDNIQTRVDSFSTYTKALYNSAIFENNALNQSNYISAEEGKAKADKELAELYSQLQSYEDSAPKSFDLSTLEGQKAKNDYDYAKKTFDDLIKSKKDASEYYANEIQKAKENFKVEFGDTGIVIGRDGKLSGSGIASKFVKENDAVVEINSKYMTKFGIFEEDGGKDAEGKPSYKFTQMDMTQQLELINTEHEGKRSGKIKNALEAAKPAELKAAEKNDGK